MHVLLLSRYSRNGASTRMRSLQYLPFLESKQIEVTVSPLFQEGYLQRLYDHRPLDWSQVAASYFERVSALLTARRFDLLWVEYELLPWIPAWVEFLLALGARPRVVDYDDAIFHRYDLSENRIVSGLLHKKIAKVMKSATAVMVGNDYLADYARSACAKRIEHIPTVIDLERYGSAIPDGVNKERSPYRIGWIGSPSTQGYLDLIAPALSEFSKASPCALVAVGASNLSIKGLTCDVRPWSENTEVDQIRGFDVGIMPLSDGPWERGKCGYKLIQYMACSLPVIASPVGVNLAIVEHGVNGFLASTGQEWVSALEVLRNTPDLGRRMGAAGRKKVEREYSLQVTGPRLVTLFEELGRSGR